MAPLTELSFPPSGTISPSVRLLETDFSAYNPGISLSKTALIGFASKGPINEPTRVTSHEELYRKFGYPNPTLDHGSYLLYAAIEFLKYGVEAWIVRVGVTDESDWDNFAKTAYVEVPSAGLPAVLRTQLVGTTQVEIVLDVNDKFRVAVDGSTYSRVIQIPAGTYTLISDPPSGLDNLVDTFNLQFSANDGVEAFECEGTLGFRATTLYGTEASLELISVEDAIYSTIEIGKTMLPGVITGANTQWPAGSSVSGFYFGDTTNPTLRIRINGTGDPTIDNITQSIPFDDLTHVADGTTVNTLGLDGPYASAADIVDLINWYIDNPSLHTATVPGGFRAEESAGAVRLTTSKYYSSGGVPLVLNGLVNGINTIDGRTALVQVKFDSNEVDTILGFDNNGQVGSTDTGISTEDFVDGIAVGGLFIDDVGKVTGAPHIGVAPTIMTIWADSPGLSGNSTQVVVQNDEDGLIRLIAYNSGINVESHGNLNLRYNETNNPYYIEQYINGYSDYLYIEHNTSVTGLPLEGTYSLGAVTATQGSDGYPYDINGLPDADAIDALVEGDPQAGTGLFSLGEPEKIDIDLVAAPALTSTSVINALIELCGVTRRDCMAIIDTPYGLDSVAVNKWHNGAHALNLTRFDSSFAALYWPWGKIRDSFNQVDVWVPPSGSICGVYANSERIGKVWSAPAGLRRGLVPSFKEMETYAYLQERDALYGNRNAVNVIVPFPVEGPTVWGQKTLQRRPTALDRVNVRRLMLYAEKVVRDATRSLLFEPHDEILRSHFVRIVSGILDQIKDGRGIYDYFIKCDAELNPPEVVDRNEMRARIGIQPVKTAEFIFIEFALFRTGTFEENA